ncbi:hypothetical protein [Brevibacillus sp. 1238]|uniref:hypothetical protein n=1 Tax=Brevibacillus sp. 1238 TaxID=2940565 RepID=UPI00247692C1|nr:hypothetical protein [Brevibacillus sp. 1238]MDH6351938.1 hypothetical protein [Brevibacillus sp. 1238]
MGIKSSDVVGLRTFHAYNFIHNKSIFVGAGKDTPWPGTPEVVPEPTYNGTIENLVALKRADQVRYALPDPAGDIEITTGQKYRLVSEEEAIANNSRWVYVQAWFKYDQFPVTTYRQTGVFVNVKLRTGVPVNKDVALPDDVESYGFFVNLSNLDPVVRDKHSRESIEYIIEL